MKIKMISVLLLIVILLLLMSYEVLAILEEAKALEVPWICVLALWAMIIAASVVLYVFAKRPGVREVIDSSALIQGLLIACAVCGALMMLTGGVLKCI